MKPLLALLLVLAAIAPATAHEARPLTVLIDEQMDGRALLSWRAPESIDQPNAPTVRLEGSCIAVGAAPESSAEYYSGHQAYACSPGLSGLKLSVSYPVFNPSVSTLVRISRKTGEVSTAALGPATKEWTAPPPTTFTGVASSYFSLGVKHILIGIDHILFFLGLLILARTPRRVLLTATGFTIAHSLTLALVALDVLRVSIPAVEASIALSIVFVASEVARGNKTTLAWRRPILVAATFGLLHGAGFAAALGEIGLPQTEKPAALLFFNLGVEAGQVMLALAAFATVSAVVRTREAFSLPALPLGVAERLAGYGLGVVSAYWFIERSAALFA
ncbi:MAG: HupE/UreJ family protein [Parvularculaceae bacterium]